MNDAPPKISNSENDYQRTDPELFLSADGNQEPAGRLG